MYVNARSMFKMMEEETKVTCTFTVHEKKEIKYTLTGKPTQIDYVLTKRKRKIIKKKNKAKD
jgi:hypothetical protein